MVPCGEFTLWADMVKVDFKDDLNNFQDDVIQSSVSSGRFSAAFCDVVTSEGEVGGGAIGVGDWEVF